jgi:hypothetical protein
MTKVRFTLKSLTLLVFMFAAASFANAQATRTWVSGVGDDVNPCSRTAPCKTFAGAVSKTADKGEIDALDPGGFGTVTITKNLTLEGQGTLASILNAGGVNGVNVNDSATATPNTIIVHLRNLSIQGAGTGADGVHFTAGRALYVENCIISGQKNSAASDGIDFSPTAAGLTFNLNVYQTQIVDNGGDGVRVATSTSTINASVDSSLLAGNVNGLEVTGGTVTITRSVADNNSGSGITVSGGAFINADDNEVTDNGTGLNNSASNFRISNNNVHRNTTGIGGAGTYSTYGNNKVIGNTTDVSASSTFTNVAATNSR